MGLVSYLQEQDQEAELAKGFPSTPQIYEVYKFPQIIHTGLNYLKIIKIQPQKSSAALCGELAAMPQGQLKLRIFVLHLPWLWHDEVMQGLRILTWGSFCLSLSSQVAVPDVAEAANGADILVFVLPHQFIGRICEQIAGQIKPGTFGISLIKVSCCLHSTQSIWSK